MDRSSFPSRFNHAQKIVVSIGLGLLLYELASYIALRLAMTDAFGIDGWFNYAPPGAKLTSPELGGGTQTAQVIVDVAAVAMWVFGSAWLFHTPTIPPTSPALLAERAPPSAHQVVHGLANRATIDRIIEGSGGRRKIRCELCFGMQHAEPFPAVGRRSERHL